MRIERVAAFEHSFERYLSHRARFGRNIPGTQAARVGEGRDFRHNRTIRIADITFGSRSAEAQANSYTSETWKPSDDDYQHHKVHLGSRHARLRARHRQRPIHPHSECRIVR